MGKEIKERAPLTRDEVLQYLNEHVAMEEKHWGVDYIYSKWAREIRDKKMAKYDAGNIIQVYSREYVDRYGNGCGSFEDALYSDGHVETACYGYLD